MKIAVIPARGGSKRIPRKNIKDFAGKPMIAWSIEAALKSNLFEKVIVSTEDDEIAAIAKKYGAELPFMRPKELADDFTNTNVVLTHAIQWLIDRGVPVEYVCCIYATAPFIRDDLVKEGYERLVQTGKSFAFSVTSFSFPVQRALRINRYGFVEALWPKNTDKRSQDLEETYHDAGQFYWGTSNAFLNNIDIFSQESIPIVLPRYLVQDIDTIEDWKRAELMFNTLITMGEITK